MTHIDNGESARSTENYDVIWLNGTFGAGKTTTAKLIVEDVPGMRLFDPEEVGYMLGHFMVHEPKDDFQLWAIWRRLVVVVIDELLTYTRGPLVVPMTLLDKTIADEIHHGLTARGIRLLHVLLDADESELQRRIAESDEHPGNPAASEQTRQWRLSKLNEYQASLTWLRAATHVIDTSVEPPAQVARHVFDLLR